MFWTKLQMATTEDAASASLSGQNLSGLSFKKWRSNHVDEVFSIATWIKLSFVADLSMMCGFRVSQNESSKKLIFSTGT
jgi:hypothetical protein